MKLKHLGPHQTQLTFENGSQVFYSYETPVAGQLSNGRYFKTSTKWSATTSRHINKWLEGVDAMELIQEDIDNLINQCA